MPGELGNKAGSGGNVAPSGGDDVFVKLHELARTDFLEYVRMCLSATNDLLTKSLKKSPKRTKGLAKKEEGEELIKSLNNSLTQFNQKFAVLASKEQIDNAKIEFVWIQNNQYRLLKQFDENKKKERWDTLPKANYEDVYGVVRVGLYSLQGLNEENGFNPNQFDATLFNNAVATLDRVKVKLEELRDLEKDLSKLNPKIEESLQRFSLTQIQVFGDFLEEKNVDPAETEKEIVLSASIASQLLIDGHFLPDNLQLADEAKELPQKFQSPIRLPRYEEHKEEVQPASLLGHFIVGEVKPSYLARMPELAELASADFKGFLAKLRTELMEEKHRLLRMVTPIRSAKPDIDAGYAILVELHAAVEVVTQSINAIRTTQDLFRCSAYIKQILEPVSARADDFIVKKKQPNLDALPKVDLEVFREKADFYLRLIAAFAATKRFDQVEFNVNSCKATIIFLLDLCQDMLPVMQLNQRLHLLDPNYAICSQEVQASDEAVQEMMKEAQVSYGQPWTPKLHVSGIPQALFNSHNKIAGVYVHGEEAEGSQLIKKNNPQSACCTIM